MPLSRPTFEPRPHFVQKVKIKTIEQYVKPEQSWDIALKMTLDVGADFNPQMYMFGFFKREEDTNEIKGWGSARNIHTLLDICNAFKGENEEMVYASMEKGVIPVKIMQKCIGKEIKVLKYVSGTYNDKPSYSFYKSVFNTKTEDEYIMNRFEKDVANGFIKDYQPEILKNIVSNTSSYKPEEREIVDDIAPEGNVSRPSAEEFDDQF